jgi:hypothetical protein
MLQPVKPLSDRLVRPVNGRFDPPVREPSVVQKRREDTPTERRVLTRNYFLLANLLNMRSSIQLTNLPLLSGFLHAKVDILNPPRVLHLYNCNAVV